MKKFLVILGILTSINIFAADIVKDNITTSTDKVGMFIQNSNSFLLCKLKMAVSWLLDFQNQCL